MERWNTHFSTVVEQEVFGVPLRLYQDPNSYNLGTTVWDASIVLAKFLEKNASKGIFQTDKVKTKRCIELGAGVGLGGIAFAMLGCQDVTLTDKIDLLPLLHKNVEVNLSNAALSATRLEGRNGDVKICELNWSSEDKLASVQPPYDYVIAADCIYHENNMQDLLDTILKLIDHKSTVLIVNESRSQTIDDEYRVTFGRNFSIKKLPSSVMDSLYYHPDIHAFVLKLRTKSNH